MNMILSRKCNLLTTAIIIIVIVNAGLKFLALPQRLGEYQIRLQYLELTLSYLKGIDDLFEYLVNLVETAAFSNSIKDHIKKLRSPFWINKEIIGKNQSITISNHSILKALSNETRMILEISTLMLINFPTNLHLPRINFLPQLLGDPMSLQLSYLISKNRTGFSFVLGIPTVKREIESYLMRTLKSIIVNMNDEEQRVTLIVICIGETDMDYVLSTAKKIHNEFTELVEQGLIDIIAPSALYYPNFENIRVTLNDLKKQVQWRTKQNLDFSFLMAYAKSKGKFYVQLEDDIVTKYRFITIMKTFEVRISAINKSWFMLDFCRLGFIGKMFKSTELPWFITYFQMFYNEKPIDFLIKDLYESEICNWIIHEKDYDCTAFESLETDKYWFQYKRSQFQHIGKFSSLHDKTTNVTDDVF